MDKYNFNEVWVLGDIHSAWNELFNSKVSAGGLIIQVGDFGAGFPKRGLKELEKLNDILKVSDKTVFACRGNHDHPDYFDGSIDFSNLKLLPDYTYLNINDKSFMFVGGAISIDRMDRIPGISWWEKETFVFDENKIDKSVEVDYLISHSAPISCYPFGFNVPIVKQWAGIESMQGSDLLAELTQERKDIEKLYEIVEPKELLYGHFHSKKRAETNIGKYELLSVNQFLRIL